MTELAHAGVKGMKWGVRKEARAKNRALNKASRIKDREEGKAAYQKEKNDYNANIDAARERVASGKSKGALHSAKKDYTTNRTELGSREAKKILRAAKERYSSDLATAQQVKYGTEAAMMLFVGAAGQVAINSLKHR